MKTKETSFLSDKEYISFNKERLNNIDEQTAKRVQEYANVRQCVECNEYNLPKGLPGEKIYVSLYPPENLVIDDNFTKGWLEDGAKRLGLSVFSTESLEWLTYGYENKIEGLDNLLEVNNDLFNRKDERSKRLVPVKSYLTSFIGVSRDIFKEIIDISLNQGVDINRGNLDVVLSYYARGPENTSSPNSITMYVGIRKKGQLPARNWSSISVNNSGLCISTALVYVEDVEDGISLYKVAPFKICWFLSMDNSTNNDPEQKAGLLYVCYVILKAYLSLKEQAATRSEVDKNFFISASHFTGINLTKLLTSNDKDVLSVLEEKTGVTESDLTRLNWNLLVLGFD